MTNDLQIFVTILGVFLLTTIILACPSLMIASIILGWNASVKFLFLCLTGVDFIGLLLTIAGEMQ